MFNIFKGLALQTPGIITLRQERPGIIIIEYIHVFVHIKLLSDQLSEKER